MSVATWEDVAVALGRPSADLTDDEQGQIEWWLEAVELIVGQRLGDVAALDQAVLKLGEVEVVADKFRRRGTEESSISVSVDDGTVTRRYENAVVDDDDEDIADRWWDLLMGRRKPKATSMGVTGGYLLR